MKEETKENPKAKTTITIEAKNSNWKSATTMASCQLVLMIYRNTSNTSRIILVNAHGYTAQKQLLQA